MVEHPHCDGVGLGSNPGGGFLECVAVTISQNQAESPVGSILHNPRAKYSIRHNPPFERAMHPRRPGASPLSVLGRLYPRTAEATVHSPCVREQSASGGSAWRH